MARKYVSRHSRTRSKRRRKGKGTSYISTRDKLRLIAVIVIVGIIFYVYRQFSLLFTDQAAITSLGWLVMSLLTIAFMSFFGMKTRKLVRYRRSKNEYEASAYHTQTHIPFKKLKAMKGKPFEYEVSRALEKAFPDTPQLNDLTLKRQKSVNEYAQIDCILFHETGIYVLEMKDYNGYVYGGKANRYWNVGYERDGKKATYEFQNPIIQNSGHVEDLKAISDGVYHNIVIFSLNTTLDTDLDELHTLDSLKSLINSKETQYTKDTLSTIKDKIEGARRLDKTDDHIKRIQHNQAKYK